MIIAVDTGGTKTLVALINNRGRIVRQERFLTPPTAEGYVHTLTDVITTRFQDSRTSAIVIALPGIVRDGVAVWCNNLGWRNFDAHAAFRSIASVPIFIENDANLAGLAEAHHLAPIPHSVLYVTISTGIGTGIIMDGVIDHGLRYSEGGRALVEYSGRVREWESFASGKAIYKDYGKFAADITSKRVWKQIANRISRGFLAIVPVLQPEVIVLGGSIGTYFSRYAPELEAILIKNLPPHILTPKIIQAVAPEQAVLYGCYQYAKQQLAK